MEFAETVLLNAARLWLNASLDEKQRLQRALFPEGIEFADGICRTGSTGLLFSGLEKVQVENERMVGPCGLEPQTSTVSR